MKKNISSFLTGVLVTGLACTLGLTALAATGQVTFGGVSVSMYGKEVLAKGEQFQAGNGESVPASMTYTDDKGGLTTYLPVSYLSKLLDAPLTWLPETGTIVVGKTMPGTGSSVTVVQPGDDDAALAALPLHRVGEKVANFTELAAMQPKTGARQVSMLPETQFRSTGGFSSQWELTSKNGEYVSVTVTNHGDKPLSFFLGRQYTVGNELLSSRIPAGETVTRTFAIDDTDSLVSPTFCAIVSYFGAMEQEVNITVTVTQFGAQD